MPKILITGGTGFVGRWMRETQPDGLQCKYIGSLDYRLWYWHVCKWDYIVHLAPVSPARAIQSIQSNGGRLLYCSSGIVYHPENDTEYRRNKIKWEQECLDYGIDAVIARLFTFYGDWLDDGKAITQFMKAAKANEQISIWGDGSTVRSYMHGLELGRIMWAILLCGKSGQAYDVGDEKPVTMLELAEAVKRAYNSTSEIFIAGGTDSMPHYLPTDMEKTRRLLDV